MPKLNKQQAKAVGDAEEMNSEGFLLEKGRYAARLRSVEEKPGNEFPYWNWEFEAIHDESGRRRAGRQWNMTSLSPKSAGFLKSTFAAFGYSEDSDTDEMIGEWVVLYLDQEPQTQGQNAGQMRNRVTRLAEFDPEEWDFDPDDVQVKDSEPVGAGSGGGDNF